MANFSQVQKVVEFLKQHANEKFTARDIALAIIQQYPDEYTEKRKNPRFTSDENFIAQIVAEIGARKPAITKSCPAIAFQDQPRPRLYWYSTEKTNPQQSDSDTVKQPLHAEHDLAHDSISLQAEALTEHALYPLLIDFLKLELNLYCLRINEKRSTNSRGQNGNHWLHPDIVAMQPLDQQWDPFVKTCVKHGSGQNVRLWSFEVKKQLNSSNLRSSFFQAVSNSSWAHEGYLVASDISNQDMDELRMLSALHGIGFILLNTQNPSESEILLPARPKPEADWQTINRILKENTDFKNFIDLVANYYQSGRIYAENWNR